MGIVLFRRIELGESWAENAGLQIVGLGSRLLLLHMIFNEPDLGSIIFRRVANEDNLQKRIIWLEVHLVMQLRNERAKPFKEGNANLLEVVLNITGLQIVRIRSVDAGDVVVQTDGFGGGGNSPLGGD